MADIDLVIKRAQEQGFRYQKTEKNHHQFYAPNGKDIVVHSGTPSDQRGWSNFMADMERAGYQPLQTLGDMMPPKLIANGGAKLSTSQYIIDFLSRHEEGMQVAEIKMYVKSMRPELSENTAYAGLNMLQQKGFVKKMPSGAWRLTDIDRSSLKLFGPKIKKDPITGKPADFYDKGKAAFDAVPAGTLTGDRAIDADLKALDNALAALAKIEGVVRKNREVLAQFAKLKVMLK